MLKTRMFSLSFNQSLMTVLIICEVAFEVTCTYSKFTFFVLHYTHYQPVSHLLEKYWGGVQLKAVRSILTIFPAKSSCCM